MRIVAGSYLEDNSKAHAAVTGRSKISLKSPRGKGKNWACLLEEGTLKNSGGYMAGHNVGGGASSCAVEGV